MNPRRTNLALYVVAAAVAATAPIVAWFGLVAPLDATNGPRPAHAVARPAAPAGTAAVPSLDSFGTTLARTYRPPLTAPPAGDVPPAIADVPVAAPARLQLVGTVGDSVALIRGPDGTVALVEVGDDVDGAAVVAIAPTRVDLRQNGRLTQLQKPLPAPVPVDLIVH